MAKARLQARLKARHGTSKTTQKPMSREELKLHIYGIESRKNEPDKVLNHSELTQELKSISKIKDLKNFTKKFILCIKNIKIPRSIDGLEVHEIELEKLKAISKAEMELLENFFDKYVAMLKPELITLLELKTASICLSKKILFKDNFGNTFNKIIAKNTEPFCNLITKISTNINNSQFHNRPLEYWDDILISIENDFPFVELEANQLEMNQKLRTINSRIEKGFLKSAHNNYKKIAKNIDKNAYNKMLSDIFVNSCIRSQETADFTYLERTIKLFKIDLQKIQIDCDGVLFTPVSFVIYIEEKFKEAYIKLLHDEFELHPDEGINKIDLTTSFSNISPLMRACLNNDFSSVKLLIQCGADVNLKTFFIDISSKLTCATPFSMALNSGNLELVEFLLQNGADPIKALKLTKHLVKSSIELADNSIVEPNIYEKLSLEKYFAQVFPIIDKYYTNKILSSIKQQELLEESKIDAFESKEDAIENEENKPQPKLDTQKLLEDYIDFRQDSLIKEQILQERTLESQFDLLLLNFIKSGTSEDQNLLYSYIKQNPELNLYDSTGLFEMIEEIDLQVILSKKKQILRDFFQAKKSEQFSRFDHSEKHMHHVRGSLDDADNIFLVSSTKLINKIYVAIDPRLMKSHEFESIKKVVSDVLSNNPQFITDNSRGISGIKSYQGIIKLKLCGEDLCLYTTKKYLDKNTGNVLIIFDKIGNHEMRINQKLTVEKVENLTELYHSIKDDEEIVDNLMPGQLIVEENANLMDVDSSDAVKILGEGG